MASIVDDKQSFLGLMLLDHVANLEHQLEVGALGGDGEDVGPEVVVVTEALLEILELGQHKQVIRLPVKHEGVHLGVSLTRVAAVGEGPVGRLQAGSDMLAMKPRREG